jgi:RNA polymerase sigma factor (sigma-70 family)
MSLMGSVTAWIAQLKTGEEAALAKLHRRYWPLLVELARKKLKGMPSRAADEEDVAQEALWGFYNTFRAGRVSRLVNRSALVALLTHIISRKALNQIKHEIGAKKRGQGQVLHASALPDAGAETGGMEWAEDEERTPLDQAILKECYHLYVDRLPPHLRDYAERYLAGCTYREIAEQLNRSEQTVSRKMALILAKWQRMAAESMDRDS